MSSQATDFAALYLSEHDRLRTMLVRRGVSTAAAADLVHDTFVRMLRTPGEDVRNLQSYLFKSAGNIAVDEHRRQRRAAAVIDVHADIDEAIADPAPAADVMLIAADEIAALHRAVAELPPRCREVLILHKFEGLSYAEIAERLGIAKNTVMVHLAKAISTLRQRMREDSSRAR